MTRKLEHTDVILATLAAIVWVAVLRPGPLSLPYFWDEADVYVPGARFIADHGMRFSPAALSDDYSRGHPPLFYLVAAVFFAAFGPGPTVGHLVAVSFTVIALVGTYLLGVRLWDRRVGVVSALLLGATPLFMSIGNMLLPEMALTAAAVFAFLALAHGRLGWAAAIGVFAVLIKETGLAGAAAVGVVVLYDAWERGGVFSKDAIRRALVAAVPLFALLAFFAFQKASVGYFVFPHHASLLAERPFGPTSLFTVFPSLFFWHGRWIVTLAALLAAWLGGSALRAALRNTELERDARWVPSRRALFIGFATLVLLNTLFFSKMFWLERYVLPAHPVVLLSAGFILVVGLEHLPVLSALPFAVATAMGLAHLWAPTGPDQEELTFAYAHVIATHREAFTAVAAGDVEEAHVLSTWPMTIELENPYLGYVDRAVRATNVRYLDGSHDTTFTHVLVSNASSRAEALRDEAEARYMARVGTFRVGSAPRLELYAR